MNQTTKIDFEGALIARCNLVKAKLLSALDPIESQKCMISAVAHAEIVGQGADIDQDPPRLFAAYPELIQAFQDGQQFSRDAIANLESMGPYVGVKFERSSEWFSSMDGSAEYKVHVAKVDDGFHSYIETSVGGGDSSIFRVAGTYATAELAEQGAASHALAADEVADVASTTGA